MRKTLKELAGLISGEISGSPATVIKGVASLAEAKEGDLCFVLEEHYLKEALKSQASALIIGRKMKMSAGKPYISVPDGRLAMAKILPLFAPAAPAVRNIHKSAVVDKSAEIGAGTSVGALTYIGAKVKIGKDCVIYPNVTVYDNVTIGDRVILHAGCRIGMDGFGFAREKDHFIKIPQLGTVIIEDDVEIYCNACVARGTLGTTVIGQGTKIDNLSHIAHNCRIGKHCAITSLVGLAGSVTFGDHVSVGGQAGFNGHITVGENTVVMAKAGVTKDVPANSVISGFPAQDHRKEMEQQARLRHLPKIYKKVQEK